MKILELRFKNLNSLYGEWFINFTHPEYVTNGIFALTGPTGAGKSTILDAICLALYGATPRLGRITKSGNEIMSRQTGECYSEVMFESQAGKFRCHWGQHRAHKKPDGNLIEARHEISDVLTDKPIETKKSLVLGIVEQKTGMDFDRFTRSILLAQGGFDTFLKADIEQKSRLLEQITGTDIYTRISKRVHEHHRDEQEKLNILKAESRGIQTLSPDQEKEICKQVKEKTNQAEVISVDLQKTQKAITWLTGIHAIKQEIQSLSQELEALQIIIQAFAPERERLDLAVKASQFDSAFSTMTAVRKQQDSDQSAKKRNEAQLPGLEKSVSLKRMVLKTAEKNVIQAKKKLENDLPLIQEIRLLDKQLVDKNRIIERKSADYANELNLIEQDTTRLKTLKTKRNTAAENLDATATYLETNKRDEWLISGFAGIDEQLENLLTIQKEIHHKRQEKSATEKTIKKNTEKLVAFTEQRKTRRLELSQITQQIEDSKQRLKQLLGDRLLREYRTEKETLFREMVFLNKISELEQHRTKLEGGKPCPLCGAKQHPYATGNIPKPDQTEKKIDSLSQLIDNAEQLEADIKKREQKDRTARKKLHDAEKLEAQASTEKKAAEKSLSNQTAELDKMVSRHGDLKKKVLSQLKPLGVFEIPDTDISVLTSSLKSRKKKWLEQTEKQSEIEKQISELDREISRIGAVIETRANLLKDKQKELDLLKQEYDNSISKRHELFGEKNPDSEEKNLRRKISDTEREEKKSIHSYNQVKEELNVVLTNLKSITNRIDDRTEELKRLESEFLDKIQAAGFISEKSYSNACLTVSQRDKLSSKAKELDDKSRDLTLRKQDRKQRISNELALKVTDLTLDDLKPQFIDLEGRLKTFRETISGLNHQLVQNDTAKKQIKEKQALIDAQKNECRRWQMLHGLIGSADGKKYRNFAQGLTFEMMVSHANNQLQKMTDRYLLVRDKDQPLELNVLDNYQAGEIRSTKNLSGGESFIVSLTLALGLSNMASRKVKVDSLFLDEGFGTLDNDSLETALETLSGLHQEGKLIGVISHIPALKERIGTQINITPLSGGKSSVLGPGCTKTD